MAELPARNAHFDSEQSVAATATDLIVVGLTQGGSLQAGRPFFIPQHCLNQLSDPLTTLSMLEAPHAQSCTLAH